MHSEQLGTHGNGVSEPLFSIVTITYQNLDGLRGAVKSVNAQSFGDFEHIVIDGRSTDGTKEWLATSFAGTWVSELDRGRYHAMNKGAAMARGKYLWFLHAGDSFGDGTVLRRVAEAIENRSEGEPDWLYGLARVVNPDSTVAGTLGYVPFTMFNFAILQRPLPHQATAMKRSLFWQLGGYDERVSIAADQVLLMEAANRSQPLAIADFLCDFDSTGISADRPWSETWQDDLTVLRQLDTSVTRWHSLDLALMFAYSTSRQAARFFRNAAMRSS